MSPSPPPFSTSKYWDERFTKDPSTFDWLLPANSLDGPLVEALSSCSNPKPRILHIGCGTSVLSLHLRAHVDDPRQVHNVDFSQVSVDLGAKWEREVYEHQAAEAEGKEKDATNQEPLSPEASTIAVKHDEGSAIEKTQHHMRWSTLDLLSLPSILALSRKDDGQPYDIIVDKGTCDAIACSKDISIPLPYPIRTPASASNTAVSSPSSTSSLFFLTRASVHPVHVLALHLAHLVPPGGRWIALSYSEQRFPFLAPFPATPEEGLLGEEVVQAGFAHPGELWRMETMVRLQAPDEASGNGAEGEGQTVQRPRIGHWLYVLVRTDRVLVVEE